MRTMRTDLRGPPGDLRGPPRTPADPCAPLRTPADPCDQLQVPSNYVNFLSLSIAFNPLLVGPASTALCVNLAACNGAAVRLARLARRAAVCACLVLRRFSLHRLCIARNR